MADCVPGAQNVPSALIYCRIAAAINLEAVCSVVIDLLFPHRDKYDSISVTPRVST